MRSGISGVLLLLLGLACAPSSTAAPRGPGKKESDVMKPANDGKKGEGLVCRTPQEVEQAIGRVCAVVGTYELRPFSSGKTQREWPVLVLAGTNKVVLLESLWDASKKPDAETVQRLRGRTVRAEGLLHGEPPAKGPANLMVPCLSPVQSLTVVEGG